MGAAAETLAALRTAVARIEAGGAGAGEASPRVALGPEGIDGALGGGLKRGALHGVTAASAAGAGAATGFAAALARRAAEKGRAVLWIRQDMAARENGELWGPGLAGIGLDPGRLILLRAPDLGVALKAAEAALASRAFACVVVEPFGAMARFDRVAGRRLALGAGRSGALAVMLRIAPPPGLPAGLLAAETRWRVTPLASAAGMALSDLDAWEEDAWGRPLARVELVRNRLGSLGRWPLAWGFDDGAFRLAERRLALRERPAARGPDAGAAQDPGARAAEPADRPRPAAGTGARPVRRAG